VPLRLGRLNEDEMRAFARGRGLEDAERRIALAQGCPGLAATWDLESYDKRRTAMLALIQSAGGAAAFSAWAQHAEKVAAARSEKLEPYLKVLYLLLEDLLHLREGAGPLRNADLREPLTRLADGLRFEWMREALRKTDELISMLRRNIQKSIALDALVVELRSFR
jgi:DNA polymerase-3 subunit delta'